MKNKVTYTVVMILLASLVSINAMQPESTPLPTKLHELRTGLETLQDKLQKLRDSLEGLKERLAPKESFVDQAGADFVNACIKLIYYGREVPISKSWTEILWEHLPSWTGEESGAEPAEEQDEDLVIKWIEPEEELPEELLADLYAQTTTAKPLSAFWKASHEVVQKPPHPIIRFEIITRPGPDVQPYKVEIQQPGLSLQEAIAIQNELTKLQIQGLLIDGDMIKKRLQEQGITVNTPEEIIRQLQEGWKSSGTSELYRDYALRRMYEPEEAEKRIKDLFARPRYLIVSDKKALQRMAKEYKKKNRATRKGPDKELAQHYWNRLDAFNKTIDSNGKRFNYSKDIKPHPEFTDPYADVFKHCSGTYLDKQLHEELCDTRTMMLTLLGEYENDVYVQSYAPIVNRITAMAKLQSNIEKAFSLSDFAKDLVSIVSSGVSLVARFAVASSTGIAQGAAGVATILDPSTWVDMTVGVLKLGVFLAREEAALADMDQAIYASIFAGNSDPLLKANHDYEQRYQQQAQMADEAYKNLKIKIDEMTWEEWVTGATRFGTELVLTWGISEVATLVASPSGRELISNLAKVLKSPGAEASVAEVVGISKITIEEGSAFAATAIESIKKNPKLLKAPGAGAAKAAMGAEVRLSKEVMAGLRNVIKRFEEHIFSEKHIARGILELGQNREAIMDSISNVIKAVNAKGLLKQGDNQIRTIINGIKDVEIRCHIKNGEVLGVNAFRMQPSKTPRDPFNPVITWP